MIRPFGIVTCAILAVTIAAADQRVNPKLASVRKALILPIDEKEGSDDVKVVACLVQKIGDTSPVESVKTKEEADAVFKVKAHIPSGATRYALGMMGGTPSADLEVQTLEGKKLWSDGVKHRLSTMGVAGAVRAEDSVACGLADRLINTLVEAMRRARDWK